MLHHAHQDADPPGFILPADRTGVDDQRRVAGDTQFGPCRRALVCAMGIELFGVAAVGDPPEAIGRQRQADALGQHRTCKVRTGDDRACRARDPRFDRAHQAIGRAGRRQARKVDLLVRQQPVGVIEDRQWHPPPHAERREPGHDAARHQQLAAERAHRSLDLATTRERGQERSQRARSAPRLDPPEPDPGARARRPHALLAWFVAP